jgi:hypothetical protein
MLQPLELIAFHAAVHRPPAKIRRLRHPDRLHRLGDRLALTGQNINLPQLGEPRINVAVPDLVLNGYRKRLRTDLLRVWSAALADIERVDRLNLLRRKGEVEDGYILGNAFWAHGFRNGGGAQLDLPAQDNLCGSLSVLEGGRRTEMVQATTSSSFGASSTGAREERSMT